MGMGMVTDMDTVMDMGTGMDMGMVNLTVLINKIKKAKSIA